MTDEAPKIDTSVPHSARIWNYWLGGRDHYEVDRVAGERYRRAFPGVVALARGSRGFLSRSVRFLADEAGIRQFLDIGTGLPAVENVHEIAQRAAPESRVVYVDNDPLVLAHARALLAGGPVGTVDCVDADVREPDAILDAAAGTLDFSEPVALVLSGVLGHVEDDAEAGEIVRRLTGKLSSGSYLSLNDGTRVLGPELADAQRGYNATGAAPYWLRTPELIGGFFEGLELLEPGVVSCPLWRPEPGTGPGEALDVFGGVGRKP